MTTQEKISSAKAKLMLEHPYIGSVAAALGLESDPDALTFSSDGVKLKYNDEYLQKVPQHEIEFALANGAMHALLKHQERESGRVSRVWQAATDLVVNSMLVKNGFVLPPYVYYDDRFDDMYAEEIYEVLKDEMITNQTRDEAEAQSDELPPKNDQESDPKQQKDQKNDYHRQNRLNIQEQQVTREEFEQMQSELQELFEQIFQKHDRQGDLPEGLKFVIPEQFSRRIDWRDKLYRYIADHAKSSYAFMPPNKHYLYQGVYLPSLTSDLLRVVIAIDTSGSIDSELLSLFLEEIESIMQQYPNYEIDLVAADAKVQSHKIFLPGDSLEYKLGGGGGTDFRPVFEYIDRYIDYPSVLLYFTDGMGRFPNREPYFDLLWIIPQARDVPFGEVAVIEKD